MTIGIIEVSLFRVPQNFISLGSFLELLLCLFTSRISIRMILHGKFTICLFYIRFRGTFLNSKYFIIIPFHLYILSIYNLIFIGKKSGKIGEKNNKINHLVSAFICIPYI